MKTPTNKIILPVFTWGALQLALLTIGATGFPLWAHHPVPRESLALEELVCGQWIFIAMLFPILGNSLRSLGLNLLLMLPFDELAGLLSNAPQSTILALLFLTALWMTGLASWELRFQNRRICLLWGIAGINFTAGGTILDYFRWEKHFTEGGVQQFSTISILPAICSWTEQHQFKIWLEAGFPMIVFLACKFAFYWLHKPQNSSSTSLHTAKNL